MAATAILQKLSFFHHPQDFPKFQISGFQFTKKPTNKAPFSKNNNSPCHSNNGNSYPVKSSQIQEISDDRGKIRRMIQEFNPKIPIEEAVTPPSSWYTDSDFFSFELNQVFYRGWQAVGTPFVEHFDISNRLKSHTNSLLAGRLGSIEYVVCRDEKGTLHAFHNVCRHHASILATGTGTKSCFICPYHGWTYGLDGALLKATRIKGIKNFKVNEMGLVPLKVSIWGPFVLINFEGGLPNEGVLDAKAVGNEWLGSAADILSTNGVDTSLDYVCRRVYTLDCNWKVFCDNYLDGGYHVSYAHKDLASGLQLDSYSTVMYEKVSIQRCAGNNSDHEEEFDRLGSKTLYAFVYPNFMINRYGPWMDTNHVLPLGPRKCQVIFDYFLDSSLMENDAFIKKSLEDSERVQDEDVILCKAVQQGLESPAYEIGRYSPTVEMAMHHFHCLLHENLSSF